MRSLSKIPFTNILWTFQTNVTNCGRLSYPTTGNTTRGITHLTMLHVIYLFINRCAFFEIIVPTVDTVRYEFITNNLLSHGDPVLLTGPVGTSKTSTALSVLDELNSEKYTVLNVNMSAQTSSINLQDAIESRLEKRTKGIFAPVGGKLLVVFLDDFNMPAKETYGSQPPLELLRQWLGYGFWYDRQKQTRKFVMVSEKTTMFGGFNLFSEYARTRCYGTTWRWSQCDF